MDRARINSFLSGPTLAALTQRARRRIAAGATPSQAESLAISVGVCAAASGPRSESTIAIAGYLATLTAAPAVRAS